MISKIFSSVPVEEKKIYGQQLYRIENAAQMKQIIHRSIGALCFQTHNKKLAAGSGLLISKDLILTAAHNIFDKEVGMEHDGFKFYLGANGIAEKYYELESWRYPPEFATCPANERLQFDYALVKLKQPIDYKEFLDLSFPCDTCLVKNNKQTRLHIFGYPVYGQNFKPLDKFVNKIKLSQFGLAKNNQIKLVEPQNYKIAYAISTEPGQSGCPIVVDGKVIAVHNGGSLGQQYNVGRLITPDLVFNLLKWCKQLNGSKFTINKKTLCPHLLNKLIETYIQSSQLKKEIKNLEVPSLNAMKSSKQLEASLKSSQTALSPVKMQLNRFYSHNYEQVAQKSDPRRPSLARSEISREFQREQMEKPVGSQLHNFNPMLPISNQFFEIMHQHLRKEQFEEIRRWNICKCSLLHPIVLSEKQRLQTWSCVLRVETSPKLDYKQ